MRPIASRVFGRSVATWALWGGTALVVLATFVMNMMDIELYTALGVAIGYFWLGLLDSQSDWLFTNVGPFNYFIFSLLYALWFAIPAAIVYVATRPFFRGWLSFLLITLWLTAFLWMFFVGPDWTGP